MRRKRKIKYWVQDTGFPGLWWVSKTKEWHRGALPGSSNVKYCTTLKSATKHARRIARGGGTPLITQFVIKNGERWSRHMWLPGNKPVYI